MARAKRLSERCATEELNMTPEPDLERLLKRELDAMRVDPSLINHGPLTSESISTGWKARLLRSNRGIVLALVANALIAFRNAPEWDGVLHHNESSMATVAKRAPPFEMTPAVPFTWADEHDVLAAAWLQHQGIPVTGEIIAAGRQRCRMSPGNIRSIQSAHTLIPQSNGMAPAVSTIGSRCTWASIHQITFGLWARSFSSAVWAEFTGPGPNSDTCLILEGYPQGALSEPGAEYSRGPISLPTIFRSSAPKIPFCKPDEFGSSNWANLTRCRRERYPVSRHSCRAR